MLVAGKQPELQWLDIDARDQPRRRRHRPVGVGVQRSARQAGHRALAAAGDVPTLEMLAAIDLLRPDRAGSEMRFINVVDHQ
ncbi:MAG: hypothetical protein IPK39_13200 [Sulfuritalea sp.]|nr:hypothetical protein [Sulfuritalea sp.]